MTRIGQQAWKEQVEDQDEDEDSKPNKPKGSNGKGRKGKGRKGKGKAKAKAKAKASPKPKASPKKRGRKPKKAQTPKNGMEDEALVTPPPKAEKIERSGSKRKGGQSLGEEAEALPTKQKKTFARRYRPSTKEGGMLWDALINAFVSIISIRVKAPSKMEAIMKHIFES